MSQIKRIFIVGHPGAGKALLAKALAEKLGWRSIFKHYLKKALSKS